MWKIVESLWMYYMLKQELEELQQIFYVILCILMFTYVLVQESLFYKVTFFFLKHYQEAGVW